MEDWKSFAAQYIDDWRQGDSRFVRGLRRGNKRPDRLRCLREAAGYYRVARNFELKYDGLKKDDPKYDEFRLGKVLDALDALDQLEPITSERVDESVESLVKQLVKQLEDDYKFTATSASSKFLWIRRHPCPVVIYDKRARTALSRLGAGKLTEHDYVGFRKAWREEFGKRKDAIICACNGLARLDDFAPTTEDGDELDSVVKADWFHERVFDKFLWWNGGE